MSSNNSHKLKSLNIANLFGGDGNAPHTNGKLDINTLFIKKNSVTEFSFDSDILLKGVRKRKLKVTETHANIYKGCCEIVTTASGTGATDIIYEVPDHVIECTDYDPYECLKFIKEKLMEQNISTHILTRKKIFITWHDLEEKINQKEEEIIQLEKNSFDYDKHNSNLSSNENVNKYNDKYSD